MAQTAQEKAQEALEIANRKVKKLEEKRDKAKADLAAAIESLEAETRNRDYVAQHPALQSVEEHRLSVQTDPHDESSHDLAAQPEKPVAGQTLGF